MRQGATSKRFAKKCDRGMVHILLRAYALRLPQPDFSLQLIHDTSLWRHVFMETYGSSPQGDDDPRWDDLFSLRGKRAFVAQNIALRALRKKTFSEAVHAVIVRGRRAA